MRRVLPRPTRSAFTLIEIVSVLLCITVLAAIAVPNFLEAQTRAKVTAAKTHLAVMREALAAYRADHLRYPPNRMAFDIPAMLPPQLQAAAAPTRENWNRFPAMDPALSPRQMGDYDAQDGSPRAGTSPKDRRRVLMERYVDATGDSATSATALQLLEATSGARTPEDVFVSLRAQKSRMSQSDSLLRHRHRMHMNGIAALMALRRPVDYLGVELHDPFVNFSPARIPLGYMNYEAYEGLTTCTLTSTNGRLPAYLVFSIGPDNSPTIENPFLGEFVQYDPTNGTVSEGDIFTVSSDSAE